MKILGICGSIRKESLNKMLLTQALGLAGEQGWTTEMADISGIPLYNEDLDGEEKPEAVERFKSAIQGADCLLITTPEYNYSVPGVLKNALDWASRPGFQSVLKGKPVAIMTASVSMVGGARCQIHLRDVLAAIMSRVYPAPDFLLPMAGSAFSPDGRLTEEKTVERLGNFVGNYLGWVESRRSR